MFCKIFFSLIFYESKLLCTFIVQLFSRVQLFVTPWTAACQASPSFTISQSLFKLMSIESVISSNHFILYRPLLLPSIFPNNRSFPRSKLFSSGGQSIGASASSISPSNENSGKPRKYRWKWKSLSHAQLCDPMDYTVCGILQSRILEWVAVLFSRASSQPRYQTQVSCTASGFFTSWATKEAQEIQLVITRYSICSSTFLNIVLDLRPHDQFWPMEMWM